MIGPSASAYLLFSSVFNLSLPLIRKSFTLDLVQVQGVDLSGPRSAADLDRFWKNYKRSLLRQGSY